MHSIPARTQLEHGFSLLHRTFLLRQVTQDRGLRPEAEDVDAERAGLEGDALEWLERCGESASRERWSLRSLLSPAVDGSTAAGDAEVGSSVTVGSGSIVMLA